MGDDRDRVSLMGRIFIINENKKAKSPDEKVMGLFYFAVGYIFITNDLY